MPRSARTDEPFDASRFARAITKAYGRDLESLHLRKRALERCLWVLRASKDAHLATSLTAKEVHALLSEHEVACTSESIAVALTRANHKTVIQSVGPDHVLRYSISQAGRMLLDETDPQQGIEVWRAEPGNPWRGWQKLEELARSLEGPLRVTDPYYAEKSLYTIETLSERREAVRFLTCKAGTRKGGKSPAALDSQAGTLVRSKRNVEIKRVPAPAPFHDRYILSENSLVLIGQGLADLGEKEAFVVSFPRSDVSDLASELERSFDALWATATAI